MKVKNNIVFLEANECCGEAFWDGIEIFQSESKAKWYNDGRGAFIYRINELYGSNELNQ